MLFDGGSMAPEKRIVVCFDAFELDLSRLELRRDGRVVPLRRKSLELVRHLVERSGQLVRKDDLVAAVWEGVAITDATLARTLFEAREALGDDSRRPRFIETVHRLGLRFIGELRGLPDSSPTFTAQRIVGRQRELARMADLRARADAGRRQMVFITGEAGIGKTSIVDAFLEGEEHALLGRGQCIEHYGAGEAYLPLLDAVGELCRGAAAATVVPVLRRVAPTWLGQFPWLIEETDRLALDRLLRGVARERMLREVAQALETLAQEHLVILALEDLHWSDRSTADLLAFLARRPTQARILVLATYRPVEAIVGENPIRAVHDELHRQNRSQTVPVEPLADPDVEALVSRRFPGASFAPELAAVVHRRTEGNPLFVVSLLEDLVSQRRIVSSADGTWRVEGRLDDIESEVTDDLRQMVRMQVDRLGVEERAAVEAASAVGVAFSAAEGAAALEQEVVTFEGHCEAMARRGLFLQRAGVREWPDGTSASEYTFRHALYRDALYESIPTARRRILHQRIGERLEIAHGGGAGAVSGLLAMHFEASHDATRAARHLRQAAEVAARRGAPREALELTRRARVHLARWPAGAERTLEELLVEIVAGPALAATQGYAAPEVEQIFTRARSLCHALGDGSQLFPVLWGLWGFWVVRGQTNVALDLARQCMELAERSADRDLLLEAHHALWVSNFFHCDLSLARRHAEAGLALYDRSQHHAHVMLFGQDPGTAALAYLSVILLHQGFEEEAIERSEAAVELGRSLGHPVSLIFGLHFGAWMHERRGDGARCRQLAGEILDLASAHALPFWHAHATWMFSRALAPADADASMAGMIAGLEALRATGAGMAVAAYMTSLARTQFDAPRIDEARRSLDDAWAIADEKGEDMMRSEMLRLHGDLELVTERRPSARRWPRTGAFARAEEHYRSAVRTARAQAATGLELRAALSLANLWQNQGRAGEARALLAPILARLPADGNSRDIREARGILTSI